MGKAAVALLVNQMESVTVQPEELLSEPEWVVRESTGPVPAHLLKSSRHELTAGPGDRASGRSRRPVTAGPHNEAARLAR